MRDCAAAGMSSAAEYLSRLTPDDVVIATTAPRSFKLLQPISYKSLADLSWFLRWVVRTEKPEPAELHAWHQELAAKFKYNSDSKAATRYRDLCNLLLVDPASIDPMELRTETINCYRRQFELSAVMLRNRNWTPDVKLRGSIPKPLPNGTSAPAIYWKDPTTYHGNIGRLGLWLAGVNAHDFSDYVHGYGATMLGQLLLQRMILAVENRYIASRSWSGPRTHFSAMRTFTQHIAHEEPIVIHNNAYIGRRFACVPISPDIYFVQATAPINIAYRYEIPIIPYTTLEQVPFESYSVRFHEALNIQRGQPLEANIKSIALASARRLIQDVGNNPTQWMIFSGDQIDTPVNRRLHRNGM